MLTHFLLHDNSLGIPLNSFVLFLVWKFKTLRNLEFALACQVVVFNLVGSVFVAPLSPISAISNEWLLATPTYVHHHNIMPLLHLELCLCWALLLTASSMSLAMSFACPKYCNKVLCGGFVGIYLLSLVFLILPASLDCNTFSASTWICQISGSCSVRCNIIRQVATRTWCVITLYCLTSISLCCFVLESKEDTEGFIGRRRSSEGQQ